MGYLVFIGRLFIRGLLFIARLEVFSEPSVAGGVVLNPAYYGMPGHTNIMIHEVGHVLGLYHVFKGVSERESCDDPCRETAPSMETGDLCADTAPTPKSKLCRDPEPANDTCGAARFPGAPFSNYMSYTGITTVLTCVPSIKATRVTLGAGGEEVWGLERIIKQSFVPGGPSMFVTA